MLAFFLDQISKRANTSFEDKKNFNVRFSVPINAEFSAPTFFLE